MRHASQWVPQYGISYGNPEGLRDRNAQVRAMPVTEAELAYKCSINERGEGAGEGRERRREKGGGRGEDGRGEEGAYHPSIDIRSRFV